MPDGTRLVVLPEADYERLLELSEDRRDAEDAVRIQARLDAGEGSMPAAVLNAILDEDRNPVRAWREYRGLSQMVCLV